MVYHTDCAHYTDCDYRNDVGWCPDYCLQWKHRDEVRVVRCNDCKWHDRCEVEDLLAKFQCIENPYCAGGERK